MVLLNGLDDPNANLKQKSSFQKKNCKVFCFLKSPNQPHFMIIPWLNMLSIFPWDFSLLFEFRPNNSIIFCLRSILFVLLSPLQHLQRQSYVIYCLKQISYHHWSLLKYLSTFWPFQLFWFMHFCMRWLIQKMKNQSFCSNHIREFAII